MKLYTQFNNPLTSKIFEFIKPYLINFKPDQNKPKFYSQTTTNSTTSTSKETKESKYTFKNLLHTLASKHSDFLTNFIYETNSDIDCLIKILFNILYSTFISLLVSFT